MYQQKLLDKFFKSPIDIKSAILLIRLSLKTTQRSLNSGISQEFIKKITKTIC